MENAGPLGSRRFLVCAQGLSDEIDVQALSDEIDAQVLSDEIDAQVLSDEIDAQVLSYEIDVQVLSDGADAQVPSGERLDRGRRETVVLVRRTAADTDRADQPAVPVDRHTARDEQ
ncbi:hypothetical protein SAMN05428938_3375 [Streptomyces sp. KS_5]|nr:hypothetical protein SAMN05428938_3375 [Streptomyces sp. KS_5]